MRKKSLWYLSGLVVVGAAVAAIYISQSALAQQRRTDSGAVLIANRRIATTDPTFRWAAVAVVDSAKEKVIGHNWKGDMPGAFVWSETIKDSTASNNSWFHRTIFWRPPNDMGIRYRDMSPAEMAMAETLFKDMDISKAKNLVITRDGITGTVTAKELGVDPAELVNRTRTRLANQSRMQNAAAKELGQ